MEWFRDTSGACVLDRLAQSVTWRHRPITGARPTPSFAPPARHRDMPPVPYPARRGEYLLSTVSKLCAAGMGLAPLVRISLLVHRCP